MPRMSLKYTLLMNIIQFIEYTFIQAFQLLCSKLFEKVEAGFIQPTTKKPGVIVIPAPPVSRSEVSFRANIKQRRTATEFPLTEDRYSLKMFLKKDAVNKFSIYKCTIPFTQSFIADTQLFEQCGKIFTH